MRQVPSAARSNVVAPFSAGLHRDLGNITLDFILLPSLAFTPPPPPRQAPSVLLMSEFGLFPEKEEYDLIQIYLEVLMLQCATFPKMCMPGDCLSNN